MTQHDRALAGSACANWSSNVTPNHPTREHATNGVRATQQTGDPGMKMFPSNPTIVLTVSRPQSGLPFLQSDHVCPALAVTDVTLATVLIVPRVSATVETSPAAVAASPSSATAGSAAPPVATTDTTAAVIMIA